MSPVWIGIWISIASLAIVAASTISNYLSKPSFVPAATAEGLRKTISDQAAEIQRLTGRMTFLEAQVEMLREEARWWQEEYRALKSAGSR